MDLELIKELRAKTGAGIVDCKKALAEANGDIEKAIEILKQGAGVQWDEKIVKAFIELIKK